MATDLQAAMREANYIADMRGQITKPFAEQDIRFGGFVQYLRDSCSQRERDLVYFSENFFRVYSLLHIEAKTLKEQLSEMSLELIKSFSQCAYRLGFQDLILEGLPPKLVKLFNNS